MTFVIIPKVDARIDPSRFEKILDGQLPDCVIGTALTLTELGAPSLNLQVGTGKVFLKGYDVQITVAETLLMAINETAKVYIQLSRNGNSEVTGAVLGRTTGALPADSMQIAEVVTDGTNITTITSIQLLKEDDSVQVFRSRTGAAADGENAAFTKHYVRDNDANNKIIAYKTYLNGAAREVRVT